MRSVTQILPSLAKVLLPVALFALLPACADKPEEEPTEKKEQEPKPRLVGRVASIPSDRKFILIQAYGTWSIETGAILTTQGPEGRAANLRATGEKLGQFAAADIQSGTLEIGDGVYSTVTPPDPAAAPAENSAAEDEPGKAAGGS